MIVTHVPCRVFRCLAVALALATAVFTTPAAFAQVVSSGMTGLVRNSAGAPVAGAAVTATHVPTGTTYNATTSAAGRYNFRSMVVGGPYTVVVRAEGYQPTQQTDVTTALGSEIDLSFQVTEAEVVSMEAFTVTGDANELDAAALGAGRVLTSEQLSIKPTSERSFADMISATPLVTIRATSGDREESQITAVGQNNRYNSILIDGSRINDQFGLNGTGLASFFNPISLEWIEQMSVQISPFDTRLAGFTGAAVNNVTKSGTNRVRGGVYYLYSGDEVFGLQFRGENGTDRENTGTKVVPRLERTTWGVYTGGPIIRNKLFFFVGYEKFESVGVGRDPRFSTPHEAAILSKLDAIATASGKDIDWGDPVTGQTSNVSEDEKIIAKLDWNINDAHRMSVRYLSAEGELPQFGNYANTTTTLNNVPGGITATPTGHFYTQTRKEESVAAQLFSQWTPDFKTELKYAHTTQDQLTPLNSVAPMILIANVSGTNVVTNTAVTNGAYVAGTEQFRHGNVINVESDQFSATGDYFWGNFVFSGGVEREQTDFYNLFRAGSYGIVAYSSLENFLNDTNAVITRNMIDPSTRPVADISDFATNGIFGQAKWDVSPRLSLLFGVRYEFAESGPGPSLNQRLLTDSGFRNDGTVDGFDAISPRLGFNLALDDDRKLQMRGGLGHFVGRAPWVFFSNSYSNTGVGGFTLRSANNELPNTLTEYLRNNFDPQNPIGSGTDNPNLVREVNWTDGDIELPQVWRANLAFDYRLDFLNSVVTAELVHTQVDQALFITQENLRPLRVGADGRQIFAGNPTTAANALYPAFTNLYRISNVSGGESTYFTLSWDRPMRNRWGFNLAYTRGDATDAQAFGQTTAGGQFGRNVVFNQNKEEIGTSDFEIKNRVQVTLSRQFEFIRNWRTTASIYYEGRTGNPYSYVYTNDLNLDGWTGNDTVAVPSGADDPRFDFSLMNAQQIQNYLAFMDRSGLSTYAGGVAPKNGWTEPWINRLDLRLEQTIPFGRTMRTKLFLDFINFGAFVSRDFFGYTEVSPLNVGNEVFRRIAIGNATSMADGRIRPAAFTAEPAGFNIENGVSRWRIQVGAKFEF